MLLRQNEKRKTNTRGNSTALETSQRTHVLMRAGHIHPRVVCVILYSAIAQ